MAAITPIMTLKGEVTQEQIAEGVEQYFEDNPGTGEEPLLLEHLQDQTPHPPYDNLAAGRFVTQLQNGMA